MYDVTFHPISERELQEFVFDIFADPELAIERVAWLTGDPERQDHLLDQIYANFPLFRERLMYGRLTIEKSVAFAAAAIAGFLRPYWYARHASLGFLAHKVPELDAHLTPLADLSPQTFEGMRRRKGTRIYENYCAGAYVRAESIFAVRAIVQDPTHAKVVHKWFDTNMNRRALETVLEYCLNRGVGFIEASGVYAPRTGETFTDPRNFRSTFTHNLRMFTTGRHVTLRSSDVESLLDALTQYRAEFVEGAYDIELEPEWVAQLPHEAIDFLARHCPQARVVLAKNPATPPDMLAMLGKDLTQDPLNSDPVTNQYLWLTVAGNASTPTEWMMQQAQRPKLHRRLFLQLAANPSAPTEVLDVLVERAYREHMPALRRELANHPNLSTTALLRLSHDSDEETRETADARVRPYLETDEPEESNTEQELESKLEESETLKTDEPASEADVQANIIVETIPMPSTELPKFKRAVRRAFADAGISCVEDLRKFSKEELLEMPGIGSGTIQLLETLLAGHGLKFAREK